MVVACEWLEQVTALDCQLASLSSLDGEEEAIVDPLSLVDR